MDRNQFGQFLEGINNLLPGETAGEVLQRTQCNTMIQALSNNEDLIMAYLLDVNFTTMTNDDLTRSLVEWNEVFGRIDGLARRIPRELGLVIYKHEKARRLLLEVQIAVARVISRAIARLSILQNH